MASMNKVILIGRLGQDVKLRTLPSGISVADLRVATDEYAGQGKERVTEWHNVTCFGKTAEVAAQYLKKGSQCSVEGRLTTRMWEKDGKKNYATEIKAESIQFLDRPETTTTVATRPVPKWEPPQMTEDDIPF